MKHIWYLFLCSSFFISAMEQPQKVSKKITKESVLLTMQEVLQSESLIALEDQKKELERYIGLTSKENAILFFKTQIVLLQEKIEKAQLRIEAQMKLLDLSREGRASVDSFSEEYCDLLEDLQQDEWVLVKDIPKE